MSFVEKVFRQKLIKNVAGEAWDLAETIRTVPGINPALISSKADLYGASYVRFTGTDRSEA